MTKPEEVQSKIKEIEPFLALASEVQFIDGSYSVGGGTVIKFYCPDRELLEKFEGKDKHSKTKQGQRYVLMLVEIQDDETPINQNNKRRIEKEELIKGGPLSKRAGILCNDSDYLGYLIIHKHITKGEKKAMVEAAEAYVRNMCGVTTRKMLDHDKQAAHKFRNFVLEPFIRAYAES